MIYNGVSAEYQVLGGIRLKERDSLKVSLSVTAHSAPQAESTREVKSRLKLDLYEDKLIEKAAHEISQKLNIRADLVELDLQELSNLLDHYREILEKSLTHPELYHTIKTTISPFEYQACVQF